MEKPWNSCKNQCSTSKHADPETLHTCEKLLLREKTKANPLFKLNITELARLWLLLSTSNRAFAVVQRSASQLLLFYHRCTSAKVSMKNFHIGFSSSRLPHIFLINKAETNHGNSRQAKYHHYCPKGLQPGLEGLVLHLFSALGGSGFCAGGSSENY